MFTYLRGIEYPVAKESIVEVAKDNGASSEVVKTLHEIPNGKYFSLLDVVQEIQEIGSGDDSTQPAW